MKGNSDLLHSVLRRIQQYAAAISPRALARLRRSCPGDCLSESREGALMDAGRAVRVRPGLREVRWFDRIYEIAIDAW